MNAEIVAFPFGTAEGLPVVKLDVEGETWSTAQADVVVGGAKQPGVWGVWIIGVADWSDVDLDQWLRQNQVITLRTLGDKGWPAADVGTVLDATEAWQAMSDGQDIDALAEYCGARAQNTAIGNDLILRLGEDSDYPSPKVFDLLDDFAQPQEQGYVYLPRGYRRTSMILRALSLCSGTWAMRWLP